MLELPTAFPLALAAERLWYAAPLIVSVSLCYAATRHEEPGPILAHGGRFALWVLIFMLVVAAGLQVFGWMQG
ncbi:MAG: hypothetical protein AAGJ46_11610 [Planctomycetota bacterium]